MSIKFSGVKGNNRIRLKPKSEDATLIAHATVVPGVNNPRVPEQIYDGSYALCLKPGEISCDGAVETLRIWDGLDYSVGWTVIINGQDYGRYTSEDPMEYYGSWQFDYLIQMGWDDGGWFYITAQQAGNIRVTLKPDSRPSTVDHWQFEDRSMMSGSSPSKNVMVGDDGSINVCLFTNQSYEPPS